MAPMCMYSSDDKGVIKDFHLVHYGARAIGGVGLIILEATAVEKRGRISANDLGIWSDEQIAPLGKLVDLIHKFGGKVGVQLGHAGRKCGVETEEAICPTSIAFSEKYKTPLEMTKEDIRQTIKAFAKGAKRADKAGFDAIEIHGAHGYLINQFLSPLTNHREDQYGGSLENRSRFLKEIIQEIRQHWPKEKPVILRISAEEYHEDGNKCEDLGKIINLVKEYGIDLINVSSGGVVLTKVNTYPGYQLKLAEKIIENGAICSEYVPGVVAERYFFPQRNRIISALSMGTLVVQGKKSSGAMLTAKYAIDQNKELFAIPGQINNPLSEGPNYLIKNGACMVTETDDILSSFINTNYMEQLTIFPELSNDEKVVYNYIKQENRPVYYDEIIINTKIQMSKLSSLLMNLELKGVIQAQGGNKYIYLY